MTVFARILVSFAVTLLLFASPLNAQEVRVGTPGGITSVSSGGNTVTGVTALALGNGTVCTPNGASTTATCNLTLSDASKSADYTVAAGDMANALNVTGAHTLTLPAVGSTIFQPGMSVTVLNSGTGNWTVTNSTGLTYGGPTTLLPGMQGTFVANADGTHLDWFGNVAATTSVYGLALLGTSGATVPLLNGANTWSGVQSFTDGDLGLKGSSSGTLTLKAASAAGTDVITFPHATDTVAVLGTAQSFTAAQTFAASGIKLLGSSTGATTLTSANSGSSNFTITLPAATGTLMEGPYSATVGWVATVNPTGALIMVAPAALTVTSIVGNVETATGTAATVSVFKAPSATACGSGTIQHSGTFNANGTAATNQTLTLVGGAGNVLAAGDRICITTTGTTAWTGGTGVGGITVNYTIP